MKNTFKNRGHETITDYANKGRDLNVIYKVAQDDSLNGREIVLDGINCMNFGSCSYLGLELHKKIIDSAKSYIDKYGVQFSSSRSFVSLKEQQLYESLLSKIFNKPVVTFTSVSLGHHAVIPVVVGRNDAIVLDQQVHASVQDAMKKMIANGVHLEVVRHNRLDLLEDRIKKLSNKYDKIWYAIDGVYSMYGDVAPIEHIVDLLNKYKKLYLYADDAHGMSINGKNGSGVLLERVKFHEKMVLAVSLNKAFASGGGAFVFNDNDLATKVRNLGGAFVFSGPLQVPVLGAGIASAKIHLSNEIVILQNQLNKKIRYCFDKLKEQGLPNLSSEETPIFFIAIGLVSTCFSLVHKLHKEGCYVNPGVYPAVPEQSAGIRFTITIHNTLEDIDYLIDRIAFHLPRVFKEQGRTIKDLHRGFKHQMSFENVMSSIQKGEYNKSGFSIKYERTIENIPKNLWDRKANEIGLNNYDQMRFFEKSFSSNPLKEHNWIFHYYIIYDEDNTVILMTYFTETIMKDDAFASKEVSYQMEESRRVLNDNYHMSSKSLIMGCQLSSGDHLYINKKNKRWKEAFNLLVDEVQEYRDNHNIPIISFRDIDSSDMELNSMFLDLGYKRLDIQEGHIVRKSCWNTNQSYIEQLKGDSSKSTSDRRRFIRKRVFKNENQFLVRIVSNPNNFDLIQYEMLYQNVFSKSLELNGYGLPGGLFKNISKFENWEVIELKHIDTLKVVGVAICFRSKVKYSFLITGIDYDFIEQDVYAQILWQTVKRANELDLDLDMGITASQSKRKFGAQLRKQSIYIQNKDNYKEVVMNMLPQYENSK